MTDEAAIGGDLWMLVYGSASVAPMDDDALGAVLEASRRNNARLGVTGMLLYRGGNFFQVLEGPERAVQDLYRRIEADPRHRGCQVFLKRAVTARMFPSWTMGLRTDADLAAEHRAALDGLLRDARDPAAHNARDARAVTTLMNVFQRIMT